MFDSIITREKLNNGVEMPRFGLGVYAAQPGDEVYNAVRWALEAGYRLVDTAATYGNEADVGRAVKDSGLGREEVFIITKLWLDGMGDAPAALDDSLRKLGVEYVDMYLMHWPGTDVDMRHRAWEAMLEQAEKGKIRACGVSNFMQDHLELLISKTGVVPANNQLEIHPWCQRRELRAYCGDKGISVTAWGPMFHGYLGKVPLMEELAQKYGHTAAQVTLRWHIQHGIDIIPKSVNKERIIQNTELFDFVLSGEDMARIDALEGGMSFVFDPYTFDGDLEAARARRDAEAAKL